MIVCILCMGHCMNKCLYSSPECRAAGGSSQGPAASLVLEQRQLAADGQVQAVAGRGRAGGGHGGEGGGRQHSTWHRYWTSSLATSLPPQTTSSMCRHNL